MATKKSNSKGILAVLSIGAGVFAWWKYKNMSSEEKAKLKAKIDETGNKIKETVAETAEKIKKTVADVEGTLSEKYEQLKNASKNETNK
jgi:uncharacterized protein HemX